MNQTKNMINKLLIINTNNKNSRFNTQKTKLNNKETTMKNKFNLIIISYMIIKQKKKN